MIEDTRQGPWRRRLSHRRLPMVVALIAVVLALPSVWSGWVGEDHAHRSQFNHSREFREIFGTPREMFSWYDGDPKRTMLMMDRGILPWWTARDIKEVFWRPLAVLTHRLDYALWPGSAVMMHVQCLVWFALMVGAIAVFYRRILGVTWVAGLAALLYAVDDARSVSVGFIANRNVLLATLFGVCALIAHDAWRRRSWRAGVLVGPVLLALSLLSAEAGIGTCAYLAAYAAIMDRGPWRRRALTMLPYLAVVIAWRLAWGHAGGGIASIGFYCDPLANPAGFVTRAAQWGPLLLMAQWAVPPSGIVLLMSPQGAAVMTVIAAVFVTALAFILWPLVRRDRVAAFFALGMLMALVPVCAAFPMDRLLIFVGIGAMGLLAQFFARVLGRPRGDTKAIWGRVPARALVLIFVSIHLVLAPLVMLFRTAYPLGPNRFFGVEVVAPPKGGGPEGQLVLINAPSVYHTLYMSVAREQNGQPVPAHVRSLAPGLPAVTVTRADARTVVIRPEDGFLHWMVDRFFLGSGRTIRQGEAVRLDGMTVTVTDLTDDGRPAEAAFTFDVPLEDASLRLMRWNGKEYVPFALALGESVELRPRGHLPPLVTLFLDHLRVLAFW